MKYKLYIVLLIIFLSLTHAKQYFDVFATPPGDISIKFIPYVIQLNSPDPVFLTVSVAEKPTKVTLEIDNIHSDLFDDGTNGDKVEGDNVYTIELSPQQITDNMDETDVYRPFVGFLNFYDGNTVTKRTNCFAQIWTPSIPNTVVHQLNPTIQYSEHIYNIVDENNSKKTNTDKEIFKEFYNWFEDDYDFFSIILMPGLSKNRFFVHISNSIQGIGVSIMDASSSYGSNGKLKGNILFPISGFFDGASKGFIHEIGHKWINFLYNTKLASGIPHFPYSTVGTGVMGISIPPINQGGSFPVHFEPDGNDGFTISTDYSLYSPYFNNLELYLMGLVPKEQVEPIIKFIDQSSPPNYGYHPQSDFETILIDDIIDVLGERNPDSNNSQTVFNMAVIIISDQLLSQHEMEFFDYFASRAESESILPVAQGFSKGDGKPFYVATGGRASLSTTLNSDNLGFDNFDNFLYDYYIYQNFPNPFNPITTISYRLEKDSDVSISVYNISGKQIITLQNEYKTLGEHSITWNGTDDLGNKVGAGVYFYQLKAGDFVQTKKMVLLK